MPKRLSRSGAGRDLRPPNSPWLPLQAQDPPAGCVSYYYSDPLARVPIREVTRPGDNKSDPNLETMTFGLFSTCERQMRASVVNNGIPFVFFTTRRRGERVLTGYYKVGWYSDSVLSPRGADFALAAIEARFIEEPIPMSRLRGKLGEHLRTRFRTFLRLDEKETQRLFKLINEREDATDLYLSEIDRLERFNEFHTGFRCWGRKMPFSWDDAATFLSASGGGIAMKKVLNASPSGLWRCEACDSIIENKSLLKLCPACGQPGTLVPEEESA